MAARLGNAREFLERGKLLALIENGEQERRHDGIEMAVRERGCQNIHLQEFDFLSEFRAPSPCLGKHRGAYVDTDDAATFRIEGYVSAGAHTGVQYRSRGALEHLPPERPIVAILERQVDKVI